MWVWREMIITADFTHANGLIRVIQHDQIHVLHAAPNRNHFLHGGGDGLWRHLKVAHCALSLRRAVHVDAHHYDYKWAKARYGKRMYLCTKNDVHVWALWAHKLSWKWRQLSKCVRARQQITFRCELAQTADVTLDERVAHEEHRTQRNGEVRLVHCGQHLHEIYEY